MARIKFLNQPWSPDDRLGDVISYWLADTSITRFRAAVAFIRLSGLARIREGLRKLLKRGTAEVVVGVDLMNTSAEALQMLLEDGVDTWIFHNSASQSTYHPKIYLLEGMASQRAILIVGSGNLTGGGLYTNYEGNISLELDLMVPDDNRILAEADSLLARYKNPSVGVVRKLDAALIHELKSQGMLLDESIEPTGLRRTKVPVKTSGAIGVGQPLFERETIPPAPLVRGLMSLPTASATSVAGQPGVMSYVQEFTRFDASRGSRPPDILIPLKAVRMVPSFWDYPGSFAPKRLKRKYEERYVGVQIWESGKRFVVQARLYRYIDRAEFRLNCRSLRDRAIAGDLLLLEKALPGVPYAYEARVVKQSEPAYQVYRQYLIHRPPRARKRFGFF